MRLCIARPSDVPVVCYAYTAQDITTTEIQHTGDNTFGVWDRMVEKVSGEEVMYSRHGGLLNDGHFSGNQWYVFSLSS